jgi:hypothetical protein
MANYSKSSVAREIDLATILDNKLDCAIKCALRDGLPVCLSSGYRATCDQNKLIWDYRRDRNRNLVPMFVGDLILIGRKSITHVPSMDIARIITLGRYYYINSFEVGIGGGHYGDAQYNDDVSATFYNVGANMRKRFYNKVPR